MNNLEKPAGSSYESKESFEISVIRPPTESLLYPQEENSPWPKEILDNREIQEQIKQRQKIISTLESVYAAIPDETMDISEALNSNRIQAEQVETFYEEWADFLESEPSNKRAILYFPFELLPSRDLSTDSATLPLAIDRFLKTYTEKWREMLSTHDVRENFITGDIPEREIRTRPLPRTSKSAHLIPLLVKKNIVSIDEVVSIMKQSEDEILRESIADSLPVLADMNLLSEATLNELEKSDDSLLRNSAIIIKSDLAHTDANRDANTALERDTSWLSRDILQMQRELEMLSEKYGQRLGTVPKARADWENQEAEKETIQKHSGEISQGLLNNSLSISDIRSLMNTNPDSSILRVSIESVRKTMEIRSQTNLQEARALYSDFEETALELWHTGEPTICDSLESMMYRLHKLQIVDQNHLDKFEIKPPSPDADFEDRSSRYVAEFSEITKSIESNPELSKFIYPVTIMYGSKIKGYGLKTADTDVAVIVRPGVPLSTREHIQEELKKVLHAEGVKGAVLEFWLSQEGNERLHVQDFSVSDKFLGESTMTHVLFGGAWCGDESTIKKLHGELLSGYLRKETVQPDIRQAWLEELEDDTLQYRLLHKGYGRLYPEQGGIQTKHSSSIDSNSAFWDSGYRRLATKLLLKKVFLPKMEVAD